MNMKTTSNTLMNDIKTNTPSFFTMKAKMTTTTMILKSFMVITSICSVYLSGIGFRCHNSIEDGDSYTHSPLEQLKRSNNKHDPLSPRRSPISEIYVLSLLESKANIFEQRNTFDSDENDDDENDDENSNNDDDNEVETGSSKTSNSNSKSNRNIVQWFQSYNGMNQTILNDYSQLTGLGTLNVTQFETMTTQEHKNLYASPHVVGCYLSHWRVLEKVWKEWKLPKSKSLSRPSQTIKKKNKEKKKKQERKKIQKRPDMLFIFEDDALCISNVIQHTWNVVQKLPVDWDILYIGGKPISYYTDGKTLSDYINMEPPTPEQWKNDSMRPSDSEFKQQLCNPTINKNQFGSQKSTSGPYPIYDNNTTTTGSNNNSRSEHEPPIYYEIKNILNTHSYVINPKRINRILRVLAKPQYEYKPIDVVLQEDMFREFYNPLSISLSQASTTNSTTNSSSSSSSTSSSSSSSAPLKAYLTPHMYCDQDAKRVIVDRDNPTGTDWEGYYWLPWRLHKGFPDSTGYMWSTMGSTRTTSTKNSSSSSSSLLKICDT